MYIDIDLDPPRRRSILPFPGDPYDEREPWIKPSKRYPGKDILPFIPKIPIPVDTDEYPVSKDEVENADRVRREAEDKAIMNASQRYINAQLKNGERHIDISKLPVGITTRHINMLIKLYEAAGWKVVHDTKERPGDPTDGWNKLDFS